MEFNTGKFNGYYWFESHQMNIINFIKLLPELLIGKYLIISHFDGGEFTPNAKELKAGFKKVNGITYTDKITEPILALNIYDNYDQWILMEERTEIKEISDFVNYSGFSLIDWDVEKQHLKNVDDSNFIKRFEIERKILKEKFWKEIDNIKPINFISDGGKFIYVTNKHSEINQLIGTVANNV